MPHGPTKPLFTVVIPLYNKASTIRRAIDSVLAQTDPDFELIIVDDGSTDSSVDAIQELLSADNVTLVRTSNRGPASARNAGIEKSIGAYISLLDADDCWDPNYLLTMRRMIANNPDGVLFTALHEVVGDDGTPVNRNSTVALNFEAPVSDFFSLYATEPIVSSSTATIERQALQKIGSFPDGVRRGEDIYVWLRLADIGPVVLSGQKLATIYLNAENRSTAQPDFPVPYHLQQIFGAPAQPFSQVNSRAIQSFAVRNALLQASGAVLTGHRSAARAIGELIWPHNRVRGAAIVLLSFMPERALRFLQRRRRS